MDSELFQGDCLDVMRTMASGSVDLIYVDPPFFTQKKHSLMSRDRTTVFQFNDAWKSRAEYLEFLTQRVRACQTVLKETGSIFFHCDSNASHHIRCLLDGIFGEEMFRSEIIWYYRRWSNSQRAPLPSHQTIFFYSKTDRYKYQQLFEEYSPSTNVDQILQRRQRDEYGKSVYARDKDGKIVYDGCKKGVPIADVWDIPFLNPKAKERAGYPTQKPILLLERIILLVTSPDDVVLDPFCGSGTTLVAAQLLDRNFLGIDISLEAINLAKHRTNNPTKTTSELLRRGRSDYIGSNSDALAYLHGISYIPVQRSSGIDALVKTAPGAQPILVRVQRRGETLLDAVERLRIAGRTKQPATLVLVVTQPEQSTDLFGEMPQEVILVKATVSDLAERLSQHGLANISSLTLGK